MPFSNYYYHSIKRQPSIL